MATPCCASPKPALSSLRQAISHVVSGAREPWGGHRAVDGRFVEKQARLLPVRMGGNNCVRGATISGSTFGANAHEAIAKELTPKERREAARYVHTESALRQREGT